MKKPIMLLIALMVISVGILCGCTNKSNEDKFIGSWEESTGAYSWIIYTFNADGTLMINDGELSGTWTLNGDKVELVVDGTEQTTQVFTYAFSDNDSILTLTFHEPYYTTTLNKMT